jgi:plastocyanin
MTRPSLTLILPLCLALAVACKGDSVGPERVLTTLEVSATSAALFPEYTSQLTISAWDQFGVPMLERFDGEWAHKATYFSSAPVIAEVSSSGLVRGVAPGTAEITATLTLDGVTRTATVTATVLSEESATVTANQNGGWSPSTVRVKAGGTVTWVVPAGVQIGTIWLNVWETNAEKLEFINGRATRTFSTPGNFYYGTGGGLMWDEEGGLVHVY